MTDTNDGQHDHENQGDKGDRGIQGIQGIQGESPTGDLLHAVRLLIGEVEELSNRLKEYPRREEVRKEGRDRAIRTLIFGVVLIVVAQLLTIGTINYCFLGPPGTVRSACQVMPGYSDAIQTGNERLARFELLLSQIAENKASIKELDLRIDLLEAGLANERQ